MSEVIPMKKTNKELNAASRQSIVEIVRPIIEKVVLEISEGRELQLVLVGDADSIPMVTNIEGERLLYAEWQLFQFTQTVTGVILRSMKKGGVYGSVDTYRAYKLSEAGEMSEGKLEAAARTMIEEALDVIERHAAKQRQRENQAANDATAQTVADDLFAGLPELAGVCVLPNTADTCTLAITATPAELAKIAAMLDQLRG